MALLVLGASLPAGCDPVLLHRPGDLAFGAATIIRIQAFNNSCSGIAVGDFDEDGHPDFATIGFDNTELSFVQTHLGNGDGSFRDPLATSVTGVVDATAVVAGDFNDDRHLDVAITGHGSAYGEVMFGDGKGFFHPAPSTFALPSGSNWSLVVGDFNDDRLPDLADIAYGTGAPSALTILIGTVPGLFKPLPPQLLPNCTYARAGDFTGDGDLDLLTNCAELFVGDGRGGFTRTLPLIGSPTEMAVADFNGDGNLDYATIGTVFLGDGHGSFNPVPWGNDTSHATLFATADFDLDGHPDLLTETESTVAVLLGDGKGNLAAPLTIGSSGSARPVGTTNLAIADFNGDGRPDILVGTENGGAQVIAFLSTAP